MSSQGQAGTASSFLSGLISQSQSATPLHRGRGRGSRGSRGRGSVNIRKATPPATTQVITPRQPSTQIIRLPVSALQGGSSTLRGSSGTSPSPRYIFVGGNNQQTTQAGSTGSASKVVVLRSPSGSVSNLSATQLLQLLQQSGALSHGANARITTQLTTKASSESTKAGQMQVSTLPAATNTSLQIADTNTDPTVNEAPTQTTSVVTQSDNVESADPISTEVNTSTPRTVAMEQDTSVVSNIQETQDSSSQISISSSSLVESTPIVQSGTTISTPSGTIRTLSMNAGEPGRYIQIPSSQGGGTILTQLVMKGGKMVLVPVDKRAATSSASSPNIIRLPGSALKSQSNTSTFSNTTTVQSTTPVILNTTSTNITTAASSQYITLPSTQSSGNKRTIQFITVPRGSSSSATSQLATKTIIVSPSGSQTSSRILKGAESVITSGNSASESGTILTGDLKGSDNSLTTGASISSLTSTIDTTNNVTSLLLQDKNSTMTENTVSGTGISSILNSKHQESFK